MATKLQVSGLSKHFISPRGDVSAIENVSFSASENEFVSIIGPSGCGKSTLLRLISGLLIPESGTIQFLDWIKPPKCRFVFQEDALFPWMTVVDNVAFGLEMDGVDLIYRREQALQYRPKGMMV
jgi:NitT/TauT family transport system ATP-binding protein